MPNMVLFEHDVDYFMMMDGSPDRMKGDEIIRNHVAPSTRVGEWLARNQIIPKFTALNNQQTCVCKYVVYANLTEIQQTDYTLRFAFT